LLVLATQLPAATLTVNSLADTDADDGECTLREAIISTNSGNPSGSMAGECAGGEFDPVVDRIEFAPAVTGTIDLNSALPNVNDPVEVIGPGADHLTIDGSAVTTNVGALRILSPTLIDGLRFVNTTSTGAGGAINTSQPLTLRAVLIEDNAAQTGGGVHSQADLTIERSVFRNNTATDFDGGAVSLVNSGKTLIVRDSLFEGNQTAPGARSGGAIRVGGSDHFTVINGSTFTDNAVAVQDGGALSIGGSSLVVTNSTFSANSAGRNGGAIHTAAVTSTLINVTVSGNVADASDDGNGNGGGVHSINAMTLRDSLLANNTDSGGEAPDCFTRDSFDSDGFNLIGIGAGCFGVSDGVNGDQVGTAAQPIDPLLASLQDNGGATPTLALLVGSPAIDAGDPAGCEDALGDPLTVDQRGRERPTDGDGDGNAVCDIGAFEAAAAEIFTDRFQVLP
jgi:CSLREA domain-containing protein